MKLSKFTKKFVTINSVAVLLSAGLPVLQPQLTGPSIVHAALTDDSGVSEWNNWNTVKWGIDSNGTLWIKPQSGAEGTTGEFDGEIAGNTIKKNTVPWYSKAASIKSVRMKGTINAYDCAFLFAGLTNCTDIDVSNLKVNNADSLVAMFAEDINLQKITGLDKFNTSNVTNMYGVFQDCKLLTDDVISGVANWDTSKVTKMTYMFWNCTSLTSIPVGNWNTSSVTSFYFTFNNCLNLKTLDVSKWNTSAVTTMYSMFTNCKSLTSLQVSNWDTGKVTDMGWIFHSCSNLTNLDVSKWNTSAVTDMSALFTGCTALTNLNVSKWNTSNVTNMSYLFNSCSSLTDLDVSNWDTSSVTTMYGMFTNCKSLTSLPVSNWDTSKVTDMDSMFISCLGLTDLDVSNWDTSSVTTMYGMFSSCSNLTKLNLSKWNTNKVTDIDSIFANCSKLSELKLGENFKIPSGQYTYLPNPIKTGEYTGRWSKADGSNGMSASDMMNLTGQEHDATGKSLNKTLTQEDRAGTWVWERGYTVTVDPNGGSGSVKTYVATLSQDQTYGTDPASVYISDPGYTRKGYEKGGVTEKVDGTGTKYQYPFTFETNNNKTIYAQWRFNGLKISYHANGGTGTMSDTTVTKGDAASLTSNSFIRRGYIFNGWNTSAQGTGTSYNNSQTVTPDSNMDLYAQWKGIPYKIKFDANTGTGLMNDESLVYGTSKAISKNAFTKEKYTFTGWNTKANGKGTAFTDQQKVSDLSASGQTVTLYAQWKKADWDSSGTDITKTDDNSNHDAGTYVLTIPTKIQKTGMPTGNVNESVSYSVNVTGNIPKGSYVHVSAAPSDGLVGSSGKLNIALTQGKTIWSEDDAYGTVNHDGSLSGTTTLDAIKITGTAKNIDRYTGLVTYSAVMNESESSKDPIPSETSWGDFSISSQDKKAIETYEGSGVGGYTAGTTLGDNETNVRSRVWSIDGAIVGYNSATYTVKDSDLARGKSDGTFKSNKLTETITYNDGTKKTAYVHLAVPLTYTLGPAIILKRTLTDNGKTATELTRWQIPTGTISFKTADTFVPNDMDLFAYPARTTLMSVDGTNIDTSNVVNMQDLFYQCSKIETIDVSGWNTSKVENIIFAFGYMSSLTSLPGIENWDTSNVTSCQATFYQSTKLHADLSKWNLDKADEGSRNGSFANDDPYVIQPNWRHKSVYGF